MRHKRQLSCTVQTKQKGNGWKCGQPCSTTYTRNYYVTHTMCKMKITCDTRSRKNFEFAFQLMTVDLLNTGGLQNLGYLEQGIFRTSRTGVPNRGYSYPKGVRRSLGHRAAYISLIEQYISQNFFGGTKNPLT